MAQTLQTVRQKALLARLARAIGRPRSDWCVVHDVDPGYLSRVLGGTALPGLRLATIIEQELGIPARAWVRS